MEVVYAVDAQKGNPMLRSMPNGLADKGQSRAHLDDGIKPSSVWKSETETSIADFLTASKGVASWNIPTFEKRCRALG